MTVQADQIRDRRRAFAAPGGSLDRMVRWLAVGLPALVGVIAALMIVSPLSPTRAGRPTASQRTMRSAWTVIQGPLRAGTLVVAEDVAVSPAGDVQSGPRR